MKKTSVKSNSKKNITKRRKSTRQPQVSARRILILVSVCIAAPILLFFAKNMFGAVGLAFLVFAISDLSEPPLVLFNIALISFLVATTYVLFARKQSGTKKKVTLIGAFIFSIAVTLFLAHFTVPTYQNYQVKHIPPQMEKFLEDRYDEDFTVVDASYRSVRILGDAKGVYAYAYPTQHAEYRFAIHEGHDKEFIEDYIKQYGAKIEAITTTQLKSDLKRLFDERIILQHVGITEMSAFEILPGEISSPKSISLAVREQFTADNWPTYKKLIVRMNQLLNEEPYKSYQYYFDIGETDKSSAPEAFYCNFLPEQRNTTTKFETRLDYCVKSYNDASKNSPLIKD